MVACVQRAAEIPTGQVELGMRGKVPGQQTPVLLGSVEEDTFESMDSRSADP